MGIVSAGAVNHGIVGFTIGRERTTAGEVSLVIVVFNANGGGYTLTPFLASGFDGDGFIIDTGDDDTVVILGNIGSVAPLAILLVAGEEAHLATIGTFDFISRRLLGTGDKSHHTQQKNEYFFHSS